MSPAGDIAADFRDVDGADPGRLAGFLLALGADPDFAAVKRRTLEALALRPGDRALDVGCGMGVEVRAMARGVGRGGAATGVDVSATMIARAREGAPAGCRFLEADLHRLPLPDAAFDAVRAERVLQHVEDPGRALAEMVRVAAPGARIVVAEPDWDTFTADLGPPEVMRLITARRGAAIRNPAVGREAHRLLTGLGCRDVHPEPVAVRVHDPALIEPAYELRAEAARAEADGALGPGAARTWERDLDRRLGEPGGLLTILVMVVTTARR